MAIIGEMKKLTIGGSTYTISVPNPWYKTTGASVGTESTYNANPSIQARTNVSNRYYAVEKDINDRLFVNVPWVMSESGITEETDPVFSASVAAGIEQTDIDNWNSKTSNTGTITKVQTSAGAHTTINVSSGNVSFNVPTKTSHLTNDSGFITTDSDEKVKQINDITTNGSFPLLLGYQVNDIEITHFVYKSYPNLTYNPSTKALNTGGTINGFTLATASAKGVDTSIATASTSTNLPTSAAVASFVENKGYALKSELPTDTNTATAADNILDGSNTGTEIKYAPYTSQQSKLSFDTSSTNPSRTDRLNLNGYLYATKLYSGGLEVLTSYTDEKLKWTASTSSNTYYPLQSTSTATTSTANTLNGISFYQYYNTAGGYRRLDLGNTTAWKSAGGAYGTIRLYGAAATYYGDLVPGVLGTASGDGHLTANRTWTFPNASGTVALTSNIPTVPTKVSAFTNDAGYITSADVPEGASAYTGTISEVTSGNASAGNNNGFARGDHVHNITKTTITNALGYTPADILIGNTRNVTPTQVLTALQAGKTVYITHEVDTNLTIYATYFDYANTLSIIVSSVLVEVFGVYYVYILTGNISTNTWSVSNTALAKNSSIPTVTNSNTTGITASTTATKTTLGTASSIYGVKSGTNSTTTASKASGSNGSASNWVFEDVACDDITAWSAGSGSASFSATVSSHVLSFSHSHTHTAPTLTYSGKTASHVKSGGNGTAPSWSFSDVTVPIRNDSATSVPSVSVASATVSISDPGHTHTI